MIRLFTLENFGGYNNLAVFRLAKFFSGGFSVSAESSQSLAAEFGGLGSKN